jgi:hypothetical protein
MALPPAASISAPALDASGWLLTTMPRLPDAGRFWHAKTVFVRSRQCPLIIDIPRKRKFSRGMFKAFRGRVKQPNKTRAHAGVLLASPM